MYPEEDLNDIDVVKNILIRTQIKLIEMMQKNGKEIK